VSIVILPADKGKREKGKRGERRRSESAAAFDPNRSQIRGWTDREN
jgi:hypothetical protein